MMSTRTSTSTQHRSSPTQVTVVRVILFAGIACSAGCRPDEPPTRRSETRSLIVLAAASVDDVVSELATRFDQTTSHKIALSAGATGALRKQIEMGAPCDLFITADPAHASALIDANLAVGGSTRVIAGNRLVVAVRRGPQPTVRGLHMPDGLIEAPFRRIAVASPDYAPAGAYARQALSKAGLWEKLAPKLVMADNARAAANYLTLRAVDAAIVYANETGPETDLMAVYTFPAESHAPIEYTGVVVTESRAAREFLDLLTSSDSEIVWRRHGFIPAAPSARAEPASAAHPIGKTAENGERP